LHSKTEKYSAIPCVLGFRYHSKYELQIYINKQHMREHWEWIEEQACKQSKLIINSARTELAYK
jgi:hypothetical protein